MGSLVGYDQALGLTLRVGNAWQSVCQAPSEVLHSAASSGLHEAKARGIFHRAVHRPYDQRSRKVDEEAGHPRRNWRGLVHDVDPHLFDELRDGASLPPLGGEHLRVVKWVESYPCWNAGLNQAESRMHAGIFNVKDAACIWA